MIGKSLNSSTITNLSKQLRMLVVLGMLFGMLAPLTQAGTAQAAETAGTASQNAPATQREAKVPILVKFKA